jgi:hypothetical protein
MIKIERMSEGCKATVNGNQIFVGQLFTYKDIETLEVLSGVVTYTVDEAEIVDVEAAPVKATAKVPAKSLPKVVAGPATA